MATTQPSRSLYDGAKREPPDEHTRLLMFLSAVDDYESLLETMPLPTSARIPRGPADASYWTIILHAAVLRKFFASGERVHIPRIVEACRSLAEPNDELEFHLSDVLNYRDADGVPSMVELVINGTIVTAWEILEVELYGKHLHVDWSKWETARTTLRGGTYDFQLSEWCFNAYVVIGKLARVIRRFMNEEATPDP